MSTDLEAFATRSRIMTDNLEEFSRRRRAQNPADETALVNALGLVEFIRMSDLYHDRGEICARLRADALRRPWHGRSSGRVSTREGEQGPRSSLQRRGETAGIPVMVSLLMPTAPPASRGRTNERRVSSAL